MSLTLWCVPNPENVRMMKILAAASCASVPIQLKNCEYGKENETKEYMANCSPCGRYPALQTEEGYIFESNAIMRHIARLDRTTSYLYGHTPFEASQIDMWLDFAMFEIDAASMPYLYNLFMGTPIPENASARVHEVMCGLELWLEPRTFFVGERMTIADIGVAFGLHAVYRFTKEGEALAKKYKNAYRLYNTVMHQPAVAAALKEHGAAIGPVKSVPAPAPKVAEKKTEKKVEKKAEAEDEDEDHKEKKKPNPLDMLPPSPFVLDAFKREYSNNDTRSVAAPYFFANYDASGYSTFMVKYKYNEENTMQFKTANLVRGWFQRMEHMHRYAFGVVLLVGEETQHDIIGMWVFRGTEMPAAVVEVVDTELFEWEQVPDVHKRVEEITDLMCWEGPTIKRPVLEGRVFK